MILQRKIGRLLSRARSALLNEHEQRASHWRLHPQADYFLARGGDEISPPSSCNIGLTNKCNLRCEICGSQKNVGVRRRHMGLETFEAVAETIFPLLGSVELNSQGDPLLYPHIAVVLERIRSHGCQIKVQTNGTLFTDHVLTLLLEQRGTVMLSLDAVGPKFDEVRRRGNWSKAEPGLQQFLSSRDPARLSVGIYPTLTERTIGEALNVVAWAAEHGVDQVVFHRYVPILESWEKPPSDEAYRATRQRLADWLAANGEPIEVRFESDVINRRPIRRRDFSHEKFPFSRVPASMPLEAKIAGAHKLDICHAPMSYLEIGLEGQIAACCRSQDIPLGYATSVESFADAWFGANYKRIRRSLQRHYGGSYTLPNCEACVKFFAPVAGGTRKSVDYAGTKHSEDALDFTHVDEILIDEMRSERGRCFVARIPPGVNQQRTALYENGQLLSAHGSLHDDIRELGGGAFAISGQSLYFSSSDGSDPRRNGRHYRLRLLPVSDDDILFDAIQAGLGLCFTAEISDASSATSRVALYEDDRLLSAHYSQHDDIRLLGGGRYAVDGKSLYFSTSDGTDARRNGRQYCLRPLPLQDDEIELGMLVHDGGHAFVADLDRSIEAHALVLLEDGKALDGSHSLHDDIRTGGCGRYSVWDKSLYFSTSDNSDPRSNGRHYRLRQIAR